MALRKQCRYLLAGRDYAMRASLIDTPDWDWVFLQQVDHDGTRYMATYIPRGGIALKSVTIPAADFHRQFRLMRRST